MEPIDIRIIPESGKRQLRKVLKFKAMDKDTQNVMFQDYRHAHCRYFRFSKTEDAVKLTMNVYKPRKFAGGQAHVIIENEAYIIYYPKEKKLITKKKEALIESVMKNEKARVALGLEAFHIEGHQSHTDFMTQRTLTSNNVLKAIIKGNCTNFDDAIRRYTKQTFGMNIGAKDIRTLRMVTFTDTYSMLKVTTNKDNLIRFAKQYETAKYPIDSRHNNLLEDLIRMSLTVCRKVNFAWSVKRIQTEHDKLSIEILQTKLKGTPIKKVDYKVKPPKLDGIELLTSNHDLVTESEIMHHCVGTSNYYLRNVLQEKTLIIRYDYKGDRGTAEVRVRKDSLYLSQFLGRRNCSMPDKAIERLKVCLDIIQESDFGTYLMAAESRKEENNSNFGRGNNMFDDEVEMALPGLPF